LAIAKDYGSGDFCPHPGLELFEELAELLDLVVGQPRTEHPIARERDLAEAVEQLGPRR
jgi:hypothetical protein